MKRYILETSKIDNEASIRFPKSKIIKYIDEYIIDRINGEMEDRGYDTVHLLENSVRLNPENNDDRRLNVIFEFSNDDGVVTTGYYSFIKDGKNIVPVSEVYDDSDEFNSTVEDYINNLQ